MRLTGSFQQITTKPGSFSGFDFDFSSRSRSGITSGIAVLAMPENKINLPFRQGPGFQLTGFQRKGAKAKACLRATTFGRRRPRSSRREEAPSLSFTVKSGGGALEPRFSF
jgi:hypothetical protein